jgi:hypothetical protein
MSPKETAIAEAAIKPVLADNYEEFYSLIAASTGATAEEVEEIIGDLTTDKTLNDLFVQILGPTDVAKLQSWYEKGMMWGQPRMTLRS